MFNFKKSCFILFYFYNIILNILTCIILKSNFVGIDIREEKKILDAGIFTWGLVLLIKTSTKVTFKLYLNSYRVFCSCKRVIDWRDFEFSCPSLFHFSYVYTLESLIGFLCLPLLGFSLKKNVYHCLVVFENVDS